MAGLVGLLAAFADIPVGVLIGGPAGAEAVLVGRQGNISGADIALAVYISVGVSGFVGLLAAFADIPVVVLIGDPLGAEAVLMGSGRRQGNIGGADIALAVDIGIGVGGLVGLLAAFTDIPVVVLIGDPLGAEAMLVGGDGDVGGANIALAVDISIGVGGRVGLFTAGAFVPVVVGIGLPLGAEAMGMCGGGSCSGGSSGWVITTACAQHCGHGKQHCQTG